MSIALYAVILLALLQPEVEKKKELRTKKLSERFLKKQSCCEGASR